MSTITKANNTDALHLTSSWVGGVVPTSADDIVWPENVVASIGSGLSCNQIHFTGSGTGGISANGASSLKVYLGGSPTTCAIGFITGTFNIECPVELMVEGVRIGFNSGTGTISGVISGAYSLYKSGASNIALTGANTFKGPFNIVQNRCTINTIKNTGAAVGSSLGKPADAAEGIINLTSAFDVVLQYNGSGDSTNRVINILGTQNVTLDHSGSGTLTFTSTPTYTNTGNKSITFGGTATLAGIFNAALVDPSGGALSIVKTGTGVWRLDATNTYTGTTTISGGYLIVNGSTHASSTVTVQSGGTLGGIGTVNGSITVESGGSIAPAGAPVTSIGTLTTANVTFNSGSFFKVSLNGTTPTNDKISSSGTIACAGTLTVDYITNAAAGKVYTIIEAATVSGTFDNAADKDIIFQQNRVFRVNYTGTTVTLTDITGNFQVSIGEIWKDIIDMQVVQSSAWKQVRRLQIVQSSAWKDT